MEKFKKMFPKTTLDNDLANLIQLNNKTVEFDDQFINKITKIVQLKTDAIKA